MDQGLYSEADLSHVPEVALELSRGCGNPTGFADLKSGEVVVDLGCGGGIDVILASLKVGPQGKVVGIDFSPQMIERAGQVVAKAGLQDRDIELRVSDMSRSQLPDGLADVIISNCVINLCPDKDAVYEEAFRILKPGGRLAISDIFLTERIDPALQERFRSNWSGCLGGAITEDDYWQTVRKAGFVGIETVSRHTLTPKELHALASCPGKEFGHVPAEEDLALVQGKVASIKFKAAKPSLD